MQPPEGPPICTALYALPSGMPPPMSKTICADAWCPSPLRPGRCGRPCPRGRRPSCPCCSRCRRRRTTRRRWPRCAGRLASVSTLLMTVGLPNRPLTAGNGGRGRGMPRLPSMLWIRAVSSPQTNAPAPILMTISRLKPLSRMLSPSRPYASAWAMACLQPLDRQRVLGADVDVGLAWRRWRRRRWPCLRAGGAGRLRSPRGP